MGMTSRTLAVVLIAMLLSAVAGAADMPGRIPLNSKALIFIDDSRSQDVSTVSNIDQLLQRYKFGTTQLGESNFGFHQPVFWVLIPLAGLTRAQHQYLEFAYPLMDKIDVYLKFPHSEWVRKSATGDQRPWSTREVESAFFYFGIPQQATHVLMRLETNGAMRFPLNLLAEAEMLRFDRHQQFSYGLYFGALLIMVLYNFVIYLLSGEKAYLFYMASLLVLTLYQAAMSGFGYMYVWQINGYWVNEHIQPITMGLAIWFICLFTREVLHINRLQTGLDQLLRWLGYSGALLAMMGVVVSFDWLIDITALWPLAVVLVVVYTGIIAFRNKIQGSGIFVLAWGGGFLGAALFTAQQLGILPVFWISEHGLKLGLLFNMTLLSFVLVSHMQQLKQDKAMLEQTAKANYQLALIDGLTGVPNRRAFDDRISSEFIRTSRDGTSMALLMLDVDYFKKYNDAYGHQMGDEALIRSALIMRNCLRRPTDSLFRYGGEEFAIILADTDVRGAEHMATRIMRTVQNLCIPHKESPYKQLTVSIGIGLTKGSDDSVENLVQRADAALYKSKRLGRNTSRVADSKDTPIVNIGDYFKNTPKDTL